MQTEITAKVNCPNCGGSISGYIDLGATHVGGGDVEIILNRVSLGAHECPPKPCPQCEAREKEEEVFLSKQAGLASQSAQEAEAYQVYLHKE